jgi:serine/threonine protein kinase
MATVYLARDIKHDRDVAIKVLRDDVAQSVGRDRFLREIQLAARLSHPHILPLYDSGDAGGALYYVMPVVQGQSLRDTLDTQRQLPIADAVRIANDTIYGLGGNVWAGTKEHGIEVAKKIRTGQISVNGGRYNPLAPFGGYKQSGLGREAGKFGLEEFLEVKSLQL